MRTLILAFIIVLLNQCTGQIKEVKTNSNSNIMEKFDRNQFMTNQVDGEYTYMSSLGKKIHQFENAESEEYIEETLDTISPYSIIRVFFKSSGNLKVRGERFYQMPIGIWEYFDEAENPVKQTNWDIPYKFTVNDLAKKMLASDVNIMLLKTGAKVSRESDDKPLYRVSHSVGITKPYDKYFLVIDGITGKTLDSTVRSVKH